MERPFLYFAAAALYLTVVQLIFFGHAIESPLYSVLHSESDYEIRLYKEISWMSAFVRGTSFQNSTKDGFHRLYQYIHGGNLNSSQLAMTAPVLTSITPSPHGSVYKVKLFVPIIYIYEGTLPVPNPQLNLQVDKWRAHCVAVRKFSGFAQDDNINKEVEALVTSLNKHLTGNAPVLGDESSFSIAQYNASHHTSGRLNEVWMVVSGFNAEGCLSQEAY